MTALSVLFALLTACGGTKVRGTGVQCPEAGDRNRVVLVGLSSSGREADLLNGRLASIRTVMKLAGDCGGPLVVTAWSASGANRVLWSTADKLDVRGGTEQARDNRLDEAVDKAMKNIIVPRLDQALSALPADRSDFLAWRGLARDAVIELRSGTDHRPTEILVLDDGVHVDDRLNLNQPLTVSEAESIAKQVPKTADLGGGIEVRIVGLGQVAGLPAPAGGEWVEAVRRFAEITCQATNAVCTALTSSIEQRTNAASRNDSTKEKKS